MALRIDQVFDVYRERYASLVRAAVSITGSLAAAEDVVQDVAVKIAELQPELDSLPHCRRYLYNAVKNRALNARRDAGRTVADETILSSLPDGESARRQEEIETYAWLRDALAELEPEVRDAFMRHVLLGERIVELARELDMLPNTLQGRFARIKARVRRHYLLFVDRMLLLRLLMGWV